MLYQLSYTHRAARERRRVAYSAAAAAQRLSSSESSRVVRLSEAAPVACGSSASVLELGAVVCRDGGVVPRIGTTLWRALEERFDGSRERGL